MRKLNRIKNKGDGNEAVISPDDIPPPTRTVDLQLVPNALTSKETVRETEAVPVPVPEVEIPTEDELKLKRKQASDERVQNVKSFIYFIMSDEIQGMIKTNTINHLNAAKLFKERTGITIPTKTARLQFKTWIIVTDEDGNKYIVKKNHLNKI